jgi:hypothetical protein
MMLVCIIAHHGIGHARSGCAQREHARRGHAQYRGARHGHARHGLHGVNVRGVKKVNGSVYDPLMYLCRILRIGFVISP